MLNIVTAATWFSFFSDTLYTSAFPLTAACYRSTNQKCIKEPENPITFSLKRHAVKISKICLVSLFTHSLLRLCRDNNIYCRCFNIIIQVAFWSCTYLHTDRPGGRTERWKNWHCVQTEWRGFLCKLDLLWKLIEILYIKHDVRDW